MSRPARILHTPTNVGNHPWQISRAERELGLDSDLIVFEPSERGYQADVIHDLSGRHRVVHGAVRARFLMRAIWHYDVFHFNFGQPLLPIHVGDRLITEVPLLKRLGKKILVTWQGCDVRPQACCFCTDPECAAVERWRAPTARMLLRYADRGFYLNPDLGAHLPGAQFLPYASVDVQALSPTPLPDRSEVVVMHAPTHRDAKGTSHVIAAVDALRAEGLAIRLDLVEDASHAEVLRRVSAADIVVDQLMLGWYGGFAVEAMALGRPVIARIDERSNPFGEGLPIVRATPRTIKDELRALAGERGRRVELAEASRRFVLSEHDPVVVARRALDGLGLIPTT